MMRSPQVIVKFRDMPVQRKSPSHELDGCFVLAHLMGDHAEEMKRLRVIRVRLENLSIDLLRRLELARSMVLDRDGESVGSHGTQN
jgi:hypothetical protein